MNKGIAITGMGIISAIGDSVEENHRNLKAMQTGIKPLSSRLESRHSGKLNVGEIRKSNSDLIELLKLPETNNYSRTSLLAVYAAKQAVENAKATVNQGKTGIISATSVGGMDMTEKYYTRYLTDTSVQKYISSHHAGDTGQKIADYLGLEEAMLTTISTACSSGANAIMLGAKLIKTGKLDRVIVGGADCLSKFTINGFNTLMILTDTHNKAFDEHRKGLNLGEAAAYLVLESDAVVQKEQKPVLGYVSGYANANDAFHQTASSEQGEGATIAMHKALKTANLLPKEIDYINAHGTATVNNDLSEGNALQNIFNKQVPEFSSTKAYTGHTLAAAGAVEAVYSVLSLQHQEIYPTLNFQTPMQAFDLRPITMLKNKSLNKVMSNSFGFGGNCSTLIFSK